MVAVASPETFYEAVGGEETFRRLVTAFYARVAVDEVLRPLYPEEDLGPAAERLRLFLVQYWGGPNMYSQRRGHPKLRMRHAPFTIGTRERDAWIAAMRGAVEETQVPEPYRAQLWQYLEMAANAMMNVWS